MKCGKPYGAKGATKQRKPETKHARHRRSRKRGTRVEGFKVSVQDACATADVDERGKQRIHKRRAQAAGAQESQRHRRRHKGRVRQGLEFKHRKFDKANEGIPVQASPRLVHVHTESQRQHAPSRDTICWFLGGKIASKCNEPPFFPLPTCH